ncbi:MAG: hypothetical protein DLM59_12305 [Pseudonocardiales bacterium]|nr:MAG: hypothetical protein DLM59_12305 [Pseudonocardiales bacterium]
MPYADLHENLARRMVEAARGDSGLSVSEVAKLIRSLARQATMPELLALHLSFMAASAEDRASRAVLEPVGGLGQSPAQAALGRHSRDQAEARDVVGAWQEVASVLDAGDGTAPRLDEHDTQGAISVLMLDLPHDDGAERLRSRADWIESGADAGTGPLHQPAAVAAALRRVSDRVEHEH